MPDKARQLPTWPMPPQLHLPPRLNTLVWAGMSWFTDFSIIQSALNCLVALQPIGARPPLLWSAAAELTRVLLSGWLYFTFIFRPGARNLLPAAAIREKPGETGRLFRAFCLVGGTNLTLRLAGLRLDHFSPFPDQYLWMTGFVTMVVGVDVLASWWQDRRARAPIVVGLEDFGLVHKAELKIKSKLTTDEQAELAKLVYEARALERTDVVRQAAGVLWGGLAVNFIVVLIEVYLGRL